MAGTLRNALVRLGWRVSVVGSTDRAREELRGHSYHAVFVELCAHGDGGGRGLARWVKAQCLETLCFVMTSWKGELESGLLRVDGIHGVVRKPLIFNEIRDEVLEHFG